MLLYTVQAYLSALQERKQLCPLPEHMDPVLDVGCLDLFNFSPYPGLSFQDFYQQCREAFLVNSDLTLRAQLTEFRDHKLIRTKRVS